MAIKATREAILAAESYETLHVPAIFQEWVTPVLDAADVESGDRVLDVACGTGVLARGARSRVGPGGHVVGLDPAEGMLAVADRIDPRIEWRQGVAEDLPFADRSFDAVVSQFGLMFFTDRDSAVREMLRVVQPHGRIAVAVWDSLENHPAYAAEVAILDDLAGKSAGNALRAPFALGDPSSVVDYFEKAGATDIKVQTSVGTARFPSIRALVSSDLRGWLPLMGVHLTEEAIEEILDIADHEMAPFVSDGTVVFESPAHVISAGPAHTSA